MAQIIRWDPKAISAVAETISLAFSPDSFIAWLRPAGAAWANLEPGSFKWQERRVLKAVAESTVYAIPGTPQIELQKKKYAETGNAERISQQRRPTYAAVAIVHPPESTFSRFRRPILRLWVYFLDLFRPVLEEGSNEQRVMMMLKKHEESKAFIEAGGPAHYVEVVAVRPDHQGQGLGGKMIRHILSQVGSGPVYLECSDASNVKFYERYGFSVVKQIELADGEGTKRQAINLWLMIRK